MTIKKQHITLVFATLFLLFKIAGLHALSHHNDEVDEQHCEVCEISTIINFTPLLKKETKVLLNTDFTFEKKRINNKVYLLIYFNKNFSGHLFTRPPPLLL